MYKDRGIILSICSKNDENIVKEMFEKRNENILKLDDFICIYTNYEKKSKNISNICKELNRDTAISTLSFKGVKVISIVSVRDSPSILSIIIKYSLISLSTLNGS